MKPATPLSVLDLATYPQGGTIAGAFETSRALAKAAEAWGYNRYWIAEHHNIEGVASSATVVLMSHIADHTKTIRVGSGGIMLPNHAPLVVAEQVGTLESLHPGRIDLGLGRAPGTDPLTMRALRRGGRGEEFDVQVAELLSYFDPAQPGQAVRAIPGEGIEVPIWILGSSLWSAHFAAAIGRPYAFASHFAPGDLLEAIAIYRREFKPSKQLAAPYVMVGVPALAAETDEHAEFLATSMYQRFLGIIRNERTALPPPVTDMDAIWTPGERYAVAERMALMVVGGAVRVAAGLSEIVRLTGADELIIASDAYDRADRLKSYEIIAQAFR
ncbi:MAG TPA: LLM class flavin-dependent oxidoreductase [Usitatibacter sp.]|jgi:luciferase family oxidoreductase group 1|nr:LLM class flavin-dependent oxidoreductase [Usitatibacter sp.]